MTDTATDATTPETHPADETSTEKPANAGSIMSNKAFWAGVGIGSAAIVAALMYARRPKDKK